MHDDDAVRDAPDDREGGTGGTCLRHLSRPVPLPPLANPGHGGTMSRYVPLVPLLGGRVLKSVRVSPNSGGNPQQKVAAAGRVWRLFDSSPAAVAVGRNS